MKKIASRLRRWLVPAYQHQVRKLHDLNYLFFELTRNCNLACLHCGSDCISESGIANLPAQKVLEVLTHIKTKHNSHNITVVLSGGEPLCYPQVFELGREITRLEYPWGMVSNGYGWNPQTIEAAKAAGMLTATISLDGLEAAHDWLRGKTGSFQKASAAIELLAKADFLQAMDVITCANQRNLAELPAIADFLAGMGITQWRIFTISPIGRAVTYPDLFLSPQQYHQLLATIKQLRTRTDIHVSLSESGYLGKHHELEVRNQYYFCTAGINTAGVMINGDMIACPNIDRRFVQGNVFTDQFLEVWEHKYQLFRDRSWLKKGRCAA
jgi:MoaA/NifB/PqqE/SkfB family radical SAM enzyme